MKQAWIVILVAMAAVGAAFALAPLLQTTDADWKNLSAPQRILDGAKPIDVEMGHAAPAVFDFNRDGKKDLLVGQFGGGKMRIYLNKGSNTAPKFRGFTYLTIGGKPASVPYG